MNSTYRINFKELRQENLKHTFAAFERAMKYVDVDFYLIGAIARDTWFVGFEDNYNFNVATLAGIVILKLIAYDDRPEIRSQDIKDIGSIINNFFDLERNAIYEHHIDLLAEDTDRRTTSARVLGRQMQAALNRNKLLKERVLMILNQNVVPLNKTGPVYLFEDENPIDLEYERMIMQQIVMGINEELP